MGKTPTNKKVSQSQQDMMQVKMKRYEKKYPQLQPSEVFQMMLEKEPNLFSNTIKRETAVKFEGTAMTFYFPKLPARPSKAKVNAGKNIVTEAMRNMEDEWNTLAEPIYNALVRKYASSHNVPNSNLDIRAFRALISKMK